MLLPKFREYSKALDEAKMQVKRKYTDNHPEVSKSSHAPVRIKVLEFLNQKGKVTKEEMGTFLKSLVEGTGKRPSWGWIKKNADLVDEYSNNETKMYCLTKRGKKVLEKHLELVKKD
jgi:hypothetical protein